MSNSKNNRRSRQFRALFECLPKEIQRLAVLAFEQFCKDPSHRSLRLHALKDTGKGRHLSGSYSVSITKQYRAIFVVDGDTNVWYWIGNHNDYENFTGVK